MRIGIDLRCLAEGRRTGVEEYTINLLENIFKQDSKNEYILFFNSYKNKDFNLPWVSQYANVKLRKFSFPNKLLNFSFWYFSWPPIDRLLGGLDVFFLPNINFLALSPKTKLLVTVHDLSFERLPETFSLKRRLWHFFINTQKICRRAEKIITISNSSKADLENLYSIDRLKIQLIYPGISDRFRPFDRNQYQLLEVQKKYSLPYHFILFLGTVEPRKNIESIIKAYEAFRRHAEKNRRHDLEKYHLIIAGQKGWFSENQENLIANSAFKQKIKRICYIEEEDKPYLINLASLFIYPSHFEGFGLPPLEAMACGVPVITSHNSSLPEVVGNSGILIDPDKPDEIYQAIWQILTSKTLKNRLCKSGLEQAKNFNWETAARKFIEIINSL